VPRLSARPRCFGSEAPAREPFAFGTERASRRKARAWPRAPVACKKPSCRRGRAKRKKGIHRPCRRHYFDPRASLARRTHQIVAEHYESAASVRSTVGSPPFDRDDARALDEHRRARRVVFDQLAEVRSSMVAARRSSQAANRSSTTLSKSCSSIPAGPLHSSG